MDLFVCICECGSASDSRLGRRGRNWRDKQSDLFIFIIWPRGLCRWRIQLDLVLWFWAEVVRIWLLSFSSSWVSGDSSKEVHIVLDHTVPYWLPLLPYTLFLPKSSTIKNFSMRATSAYVHYSYSILADNCQFVDWYNTHCCYLV